METGISILLGLIQFIIIIYIIIFELRKKSPAVFLWATLGIMFGIMHLLTVFVVMDIYNNEIYIDASLFTIGFSLLYILGRKIFIFTNKLELNLLHVWNDITNIDAKILKILSFIFCVSPIVLSLNIIMYSGNIIDSSWSTFRGYTLSQDYVNLSQILTILFFSLGAIWIFWLKKRKYITSTIIILLISFSVIISRNRILILPLLVTFIVGKILDNKKIKIKFIMKSSILALVSIYIVYALRVFRHNGSIATFLDNMSVISFIEQINEYLITDNGELGLRRVFYYFIANDNNFNGFSEGATYIRMMLVYFPSQFSFGLKPDDFAITMGKAIGMGYGGSVHPTLLGDCYANLGFLGIFLGIFWAFYANFFDYILVRIKSSEFVLLSYSLMSVSYVIIARGSVYNGFFFLAWGLPLLYFIKKLVYFILNSKVKI